MLELEETKLDELTNFAEELADIARKKIIPYFRSQLSIDDKPTNSPAGQPVTEADLEAETSMRNFISKHYPDHGIVGEEFPSINPDSELCWVLDPIDGTRAFIAGLPMFGTLIGLGLKGMPVLGVLDQPIIKDRFIGTRNGTTLNKQQIKTRSCQHLAEAVYSITDPRMMTSSTQKAVLQKLMRTTHITQFGGNCNA